VGGQGSLEPGAHAGWLALAYTTTGGAPIWVRSIPLADPDSFASIFAVAVAQDGRVYLTGEQDQTLTTEVVVQP
jgi:hypothetical protein